MKKPFIYEENNNLIFDIDAYENYNKQETSKPKASKYEDFYLLLITLRNFLTLFSIEKCAYECGVTSQTVRNFEDRKSTNVDVILFYINELNSFFNENTDKSLITIKNYYYKKLYETLGIKEVR